MNTFLMLVKIAKEWTSAIVNEADFKSNKYDQLDDFSNFLIDHL